MPQRWIIFSDTDTAWIWFRTSNYFLYTCICNVICCILMSSLTAAVCNPRLWFSNPFLFPRVSQPGPRPLSLIRIGPPGPPGNKDNISEAPTRLTSRLAHQTAERRCTDWSIESQWLLLPPFSPHDMMRPCFPLVSSTQSAPPHCAALPRFANQNRDLPTVSRWSVSETEKCCSWLPALPMKKHAAHPMKKNHIPVPCLPKQCMFLIFRFTVEGSRV